MKFDNKFPRISPRSVPNYERENRMSLNYQPIDLMRHCSKRIQRKPLVHMLANCSVVVIDLIKILLGFNYVRNQ